MALFDDIADDPPAPSSLPAGAPPPAQFARAPSPKYQTADDPTAQSLNWMMTGTADRSDPAQLGMPHYYDDLPHLERNQDPKDRTISVLANAGGLGFLPYIRAGVEAQNRGESFWGGSERYERERKALQQYYNDAYERAQDEVRVLGGIGLPGGPMAQVGKYLTSASRPVVTGAGLGATQAGVAGYLAPVEPATGDVEARLKSAAESIPYGAAFGAGAGAVGKAAQSLRPQLSTPEQLDAFHQKIAETAPERAPNPFNENVRAADAIHNQGRLIEDQTGRPPEEARPAVPPEKPAPAGLFDDIPDAVQVGAKTSLPVEQAPPVSPAEARPPVPVEPAQTAGGMFADIPDAITAAPEAQGSPQAAVTEQAPNVAPQDPLAPQGQMYTISGERPVKQYEMGRRGDDEVQQFITRAEANPVTTHGDFDIHRVVGGAYGPLEYHVVKKGEPLRFYDENGDPIERVADASVRLMGGPYMSPVKVHPDYKGKGVGRMLYDAVDADLSHVNRRLFPDYTLSADAVKFWKKRRPEALQGFEEFDGGIGGMSRSLGEEPMYAISGDRSQFRGVFPEGQEAEHYAMKLTDAEPFIFNAVERSGRLDKVAADLESGKVDDKTRMTLGFATQDVDLLAKKLGLEGGNQSTPVEIALQDAKQARDALQESYEAKDPERFKEASQALKTALAEAVQGNIEVQRRRLEPNAFNHWMENYLPEGVKAALAEKPAAAAGPTVSRAQIQDQIRERLKAGETHDVDPSDVAGTKAVIQAHSHEIPAEAKVATLTRLIPQHGGADVELVFETTDGRTFSHLIDADDLFANRAAFDPVQKVITLLEVGGRGTPYETAKAIGGGIRHEGVHAGRFLRKWTDGEWGDLLNHAENNLQSLDWDAHDWFKLIGLNPNADNKGRSLRGEYEHVYRDYPEAQRTEYLNQEAVAHMVEGYHHIAQLPSDHPVYQRLMPLYAPVEPLLHKIFTGEIAARTPEDIARLNGFLKP